MKIGYETVPIHQVNRELRENAEEMYKFCVKDLSIKDDAPRVEWIAEMSAVRRKYWGVVTVDSDIKINGRYLSREKIIQLAIDQTPSQILDTVAHEMRHHWQRQGPKKNAVPAGFNREYDASFYAENAVRGFKMYWPGNDWRARLFTSKDFYVEPIARAEANVEVAENKTLSVKGRIAIKKAPRNVTDKMTPISGREVRGLLKQGKAPAEVSKVLASRGHNAGAVEIVVAAYSGKGRTFDASLAIRPRRKKA